MSALSEESLPATLRDALVRLKGAVKCSVRENTLQSAEQTNNRAADSVTYDFPLTMPLRQHYHS